ncbi:MAG: hypothetical protein ACFFKA_18170 [Candidatus Thorarchaeota archaeon]
MSLEIIEKESQSSEENIADEDSINLSNVIIPFSNFFTRIELFDLYSGEENIPFEERAPEFKQILQAEFL